MFLTTPGPPLAGRAIGLGVRTQNNAVPDAVIEDIQITRNILRNLGAGLLIFGRDELAGNTGALRRVRVENNLFIDILESNSQPGFNTAGFLQPFILALKMFRFCTTPTLVKAATSFCTCWI